MQQPGDRNRRLVAGATLALLALIVGATGSARLLQEPSPGFLFWRNGMLVAFHLESWPGAEAGLPFNGGRIVGFEGEAFPGAEALRARVAAAPAGTVFAYEIESSDRHRVYMVRSHVLSFAGYLATFGVYLLNGVTFLLVALVAWALRPDLLAARSLAVASGFMGVLMCSSIDFITGQRLVPAVQMVEALTPVALAHFALVFPEERVGRRTRIGWVSALAVVFGGLGLANVLLFDTSPWTARTISVVLYVAVAATGLGAVLGQGDALLRASTPRARLQGSVVFSAALVAIALPAVAVLSFVTLGWNVSFTWITFLLPLYPLAVLYAVVRHNLLEAERFVRLTVGFAVATASVAVLYATALLAVERLLGPDEAGPLVSFLLLLGLAIGFEPLRRRGQRLLDRLFYRSNIDAAEVLERSGSDLAALESEPAVVAHVEEKIRAALGVDWCRLGPPDGEEEAALVEEVRFRDERLGAIRCGPKLNGAPFSPEERDVVRGLSAQAALALRNLHSYEDLRETQAALFRHERLAAIGEIAGAVAHGVRNPLAGIRTTAQTALEGPVEGEQAEFLTSILEDTDRLDQRVRTLLDFSRPFRPTLQEVPLRELLDSVARAFARSAEREGVELSVDVDPATATASLDPDYVEEALLELVGNALRALGRGDRIELEARSGPTKVELRVRDTGPGIPEAVQSRVFELFYTTRREGTGVGLASVRKIVERHGGLARLESSSGAGTCFVLELPQSSGRGIESL